MNAKEIKNMARCVVCGQPRSSNHHCSPRVIAGREVAQRRALHNETDLPPTPYGARLATGFRMLGACGH